MTKLEAVQFCGKLLNQNGGDTRNEILVVLSKHCFEVSHGFSK